MLNKNKQTNISLGVLLWFSGLRIQHCCYSGSGHFFGTGSTLSPGIFTCLRCSQKKKKSVTLSQSQGPNFHFTLLSSPFPSAPLSNQHFNFLAYFFCSSFAKMER